MSKEHPDGIEPDEVDDVLLCIKAAWLRHPHLRLMQLIHVAVDLTYPTTRSAEKFYLEDSELVGALNDY